LEGGGELRRKLWIVITFLKWSLFFIATPFNIAFVSGILPPVWASISWLVFMFGHFGSEYFFPSGYRALEAVSKRPVFRFWYRFLFLVDGAAILFVITALLAYKFTWFPLVQVRMVLVIGLGAAVSLCVLFFSFRDFLIYRYWPHEARNA
jgi:hypothetical protein